MSYFFWAHVIFWAVLFIYIYSLVRKSENLKKEVDALKSSLESYKKENPNWLRQEVK
jgi:hypothetical protein